MAQFPYDDDVARSEWSNLTNNEYIEIELGPTGGPPDVTYTIIDASSVSDSSGTWPDNSKTFTAPSAEWLETTATSGTQDKIIFIKAKPHGGLPDPPA